MGMHFPRNFYCPWQQKPYFESKKGAELAQTSVTMLEYGGAWTLA